MLCSSSLRRARPLLGTIVEIEVRGLDEWDGNRAVDAAFEVIAEVQRRMSFHDPGSTLSGLNRSATGEAVRVDAWTFEVLETAADLHRVSRGVFDVTIAPRLQSLGFLPRPDNARGGARTGARTVSFADVELLPNERVRFLQPGVCIDLGGIAKGFAVDQAVAALRHAGAPGGLVNAGGDLRAFGDAAFSVAIRHPDAPGAAFGSVTLQNAALATSAHYFADRLVPTAELGPIIDPLSRQQAAATRSATVRARSAMLADALTKVAMISGQDALPVLTHFGADAILVAKSGEAVCSGALHAAFEFSS